MLKLAGGGAASTGGRTLGGAGASSLLVTSENREANASVMPRLKTHLHKNLTSLKIQNTDGIMFKSIIINHQQTQLHKALVKS